MSKILNTKVNVHQKPTLKIKNRKAIYYHIYYESLIVECIETVNSFPSDYDKIITVNPKFSSDNIKLIKSSTNALILSTDNTGRDIYPFWLLCLESYFDKYEIVCKFHGKKSRHRADGDEWRLAAKKNLIGDLTRIKKIEDYLLHSSDPITFLADRTSTCLRSTQSHWVSNLDNIQMLFARKNVSIKRDELDRIPILTGSFYWITRLGFLKIKSIPINFNDWNDNLHDSSQKVDGALEHAFERVLAMGYPFLKSTSGFSLINTSGDIEYLESKDIGKAQSIVNQTDDDEYLTDIISSYQTEYNHKKQSMKIKGYVMDLHHPYKKLKIILSIKGSKDKVITANRIVDELSIPGIYNGGCGFEFDIDNLDDTKLLTITLDNSRVEVKKGINISSHLDVIRSSILFKHTNLHTFSTPETLRVSDIKSSVKLRHDKTYKKLKDYYSSLSTTMSNNIESVKHVFIVNNPITEILTGRVIRKKKLSSQDVIVVLHRMKESKLLCEYNIIHTHLPDIENLFNKNLLFDVVAFIENFQSKFPKMKYALYAQHYFSTISYLLGWHHKCLQTNLLEEGNLSSVQSFQDERLMMIEKGKTIVPFIQETLSMELKSNKIIQMILPDLFDLSAYVYINDVLDFYKSPITAFDTISNLFSINQHYDQHTMFMLLCMRRFYLWHPKMTLYSEAWSVARAFVNDPFLYEAYGKTPKENNLMKKYASKIVDNKVIFIMPNSASFKIFRYSESKNNIKNIIDKYKNMKISIFYKLHPADMLADESAKNMLCELTGITKDKVLNIDSIIHEGVVTEILASAFDNVIHCGSSISLLLRSYNKSTNELILKEFK
jgi:hypothetical protein